MDGYQPIDLSGLCNGGLEVLAGHRAPPESDQVFHGLPFRIGSRGHAAAPCFVVLEPGQDLIVPGGNIADHMITVTPQGSMDVATAAQCADLGVHRLNLMLPWNAGEAELAAFFERVVGPLARASRG